MSDATKAEIKNLEDRRFQAMIDSDFDTPGKLRLLVVAAEPCGLHGGLPNSGRSGAAGNAGGPWVLFR